MEEKKMEGKTCCVTGHRNLPQKEIGRVKTALRREIDSAVADGFTRFMSGFCGRRGPVFCRDRTGKEKDNPASMAIWQRAWTRVLFISHIRCAIFAGNR